jgi:quercetin dioxygenase-like cupin family protein
MRSVRISLPLLGAAIVAVAVGGTVAAQPARPVATTLASGSLPTPAHTMVVQHGEMGTVAGMADVREVRVVKFELSPGGAFPWHQHPGPVWVVVTRGVLTFYSAGCDARPHPVGSAFFDPGNLTHTARNEGDEPVEVIATFMFPADAGAASVPHAHSARCHIEA